MLFCDVNIAVNALVTMPCELLLSRCLQTPTQGPYAARSEPLIGLWPGFGPNSVNQTQRVEWQMEVQLICALFLCCVLMFAETLEIWAHSLI